MPKTKTEKRKKAIEILERSLERSYDGLRLFQNTPFKKLSDMEMIMYYQEKIYKTKEQIARLKGML